MISTKIEFISVDSVQKTNNKLTDVYSLQRNDARQIGLISLMRNISHIFMPVNYPSSEKREKSRLASEENQLSGDRDINEISIIDVLTAQPDMVIIDVQWRLAVESVLRVLSRERIDHQKRRAKNNSILDVFLPDVGINSSCIHDHWAWSYRFPSSLECDWQHSFAFDFALIKSNSRVTSEERTPLPLSRSKTYCGSRKGIALARRTSSRIFFWLRFLRISWMISRRRWSVNPLEMTTLLSVIVWFFWRDFFSALWSNSKSSRRSGMISILVEQSNRGHPSDWIYCTERAFYRGVHR